MRANARKIRARRSGFTLLEAMLALVIFGFVMFALSLALSVALQTQSAAMRRQDDNGEVRAIFASLTRDLSEAFCSMNNQTSVFKSGSGQGSSGSLGSNLSTSALLLFTTLSHRIDVGDSNGFSDNGPQSASGAAPQSDCSLVRYDFDPTTRSLSRTVSAIPNLDQFSQMNPGPQNLLSRRVLSITLRFWDTQQSQWLDTWDFEQQVEAQNQDQSGQTGQTGASTSTGSTGTTGASGSSATGAGSSGTSGTGATNGQGNSTPSDVYIPGAVEVTVTLVKADGAPATYKTLIPIHSATVTPKTSVAATAGNTNGSIGSTNSLGGGSGNSGASGGTGSGTPSSTGGTATGQ